MSENTEPRSAAAPDPDQHSGNAGHRTWSLKPLEDDADFVTSLDTAGGAHQPSAVPVSTQSGALPGPRKRSRCCARSSPATAS